MSNPFLIQTDKSIVALRGPRKGYLQIAPAFEVTKFASISPYLLIAAHEWAIALENLGAKNVFWITLAEILPHKHFHIYPRWIEDAEQGLELFNLRNEAKQPAWTREADETLFEWAHDHDVHVV
jgi:diadenosine tetraphosphate (Ap4A) HIT family hydrolase